VSALSDLKGCQSIIDSAWSFVAAPLLTATIDQALGVPAPDGSPAVISAQGAACLKAAATCQQVAERLNDVARNQLPTAWRGDAGENAGQAVSALSAEATTAGNVLGQAGRALQAWGDNLATAQRDDSSGRDTLHQAKSHLGPLGGWLSGLVEVVDPGGFISAVEHARSGIASMVNAASLAQNSGEATAGILTYLGDQARAERVATSGLDPLDAVVLAGAQNAASDGGGAILSAAELTRASSLMNGMSAAQQHEFEQLLANSRSPEEAAYLMKALAAGNSLAAIEQFDALIHPYGNDLDWLSQHLAPDLADGTYDGVSFFHWPNLQPGYGYDTYSQGGIGDCVAASTVVALANLDPVFMLKLTTGDQPAASGADSVASFVHRLQQSYISNYQTGQHADGDSGVYPKVDGGLGSTGENVLANSDLGQATGTPYHYVSLNGAGDNQAALTQVEQAVDSGQPVPIDVTNGHDNHQMVIIGSDGGSLEIYNPWGYSGWVSNQQFLSNQLGALTSSQPPAMPTATGLELPSS
jgi:uncharacterized protein YukE